MTIDVTSNPLSIAVVGTGGVGGYFGGRLALVGHNVTFVARGEHLVALRKQGLRVSSIEGDFTVDNIVVTDDLASIPSQDLVLFSTKDWQVPEAAQQIKNAVTDDTLLVPLLNGVDAPSQLQDVFGKANVLGGLCKIISYIEAPGVIRHTGAVPYVAFGELDGKISRRCQRLSDAFEDAQIKHKVSSNIKADMWEKFLFISAMSALGTITSSPIGVIRENKVTRKALFDVMTEIQMLAKRLNIKLQDDIVDKTMRFVDMLPPGSTTSMQRDIASGKLSEIEAQLGSVVKLAHEHQVETPVSNFIYATINMQVKG
jgi:2-dehydropantoate 2-reductase